MRGKGGDCDDLATIYCEARVNHDVSFEPWMKVVVYLVQRWSKSQTMKQTSGMKCRNEEEEFCHIFSSSVYC